MDINIHAKSVRTYVSSTGNVEEYETTVISDKPLYYKDSDDYNLKTSAAIERLLVWKTGAGGQGGSMCRDKFPEPNEAGCYKYVFQTRNYCD